MSFDAAEDAEEQLKLAQQRLRRAQRASRRQSCTACHAGGVAVGLLSRASSLLFFSPSGESSGGAGMASATGPSTATASTTTAPQNAPELGPSVADSTSERLAIVRDGAQRLTTSLGARAASTRDFLSEALKVKQNEGLDEVNELSAGAAEKEASSSSVVLGASFTSESSTTSRQSWGRIPPLLRRLKFAPLAAVEYLGAAPGPSSEDSDADALALSTLSQECWQLWRQKHAALSASEQVYASLLADSRRTSALSAEVKAIEDMLAEVEASSPSKGQAPASSSSTAGAGSASSEAATLARRSRTWSEPLSAEVTRKALQRCCDAIKAQASDAKESFRERVQCYPCGRLCKITGHLRVARVREDVDQVLAAFEESVDKETQEALTQAAEITVVPSAAALATTLSRRLAFWEAEIEENWSHWSAQASAYHDACQKASETWTRLLERAQALIKKVSDPSASPSEETPPILYLVPLLDHRAVQSHRRWDDAHDAFCKTIAFLCLLGAWTEYHNLRGDGAVLLEARDLFKEILALLESRFERFCGSEAAHQLLLVDDVWPLVYPLAEESWKVRRQRACSALSPSEEDLAVVSEGLNPWWSPKSWRPEAASEPTSFEVGAASQSTSKA